MIKKLFAKIVGKKTAASNIIGQAQKIPHSKHKIDAALVSPYAVRVTQTLQQAGFEAYIVGGAVRDLMLGFRPKDFDVATNAKPEEIKRLFRRAIIIGRRFQLVHVVFSNETIEVSTFRALQSGQSSNNLTDEHGRVLRDNVFGTLDEDAARRDFTINALYYDPENQIVLDFHQGVKDIANKQVRMIGEADARYREDPVRILRAIRFAAKLGFTLETATRAPIAACTPLIQNVPSSRLFDEILKFLLTGHAMQSLRMLRAEGLHHGLLPLLDVILDAPSSMQFVEKALDETDARVLAGKSVSPSFLFAALLWPLVKSTWEQNLAKGEHTIPALNAAMDTVLDAQTERLAIVRRITADMREIWGAQPRFEKRSGRMPFRLIEHKRLRAAYDFMLLRCETGELPTSFGEWWTDFLTGDEKQRLDLIDSLRKGDGAAGTVRKKRRRKPKSSENVTQLASE